MVVAPLRVTSDGSLIDNHFMDFGKHYMHKSWLPFDDIHVFTYLDYGLNNNWDNLTDIVQGHVNLIVTCYKILTHIFILSE